LGQRDNSSYLHENYILLEASKVSRIFFSCSGSIKLANCPKKEKKKKKPKTREPQHLINRTDEL
jgi:hypothetical protein